MPHRSWRPVCVGDREHEVQATYPSLTFPISKIRKLRGFSCETFERFTRLTKDLVAPDLQLAAEIRLLQVVHERLTLGRTIIVQQSGPLSLNTMLDLLARADLSSVDTARVTTFGGFCRSQDCARLILADLACFFLNGLQSCAATQLDRFCTFAQVKPPRSAVIERFSRLIALAFIQRIEMRVEKIYAVYAASRGKSVKMHQNLTPTPAARMQNARQARDSASLQHSVALNIFSMPH